MILSMTGFASTTREFPGGLLSIELRAVNHRYLDVQMRLPEELRVIEPQMRELIAGKVTRGKVECRIGLNQTEVTTVKGFEKALNDARGNIALLVRRGDSTLFVPLRMN